MIDFKQRLDNLARKFHITMDDYHLVMGNPKLEILDYAKKKSADMIIIGDNHHNRLAETFLGSTAHHVLNHASCDVVLVKNA